MDENWLPGRSVGHRDSHSGSLGLFVDVERETKVKAKFDPDVPMAAFVSAAHVLAPPSANPDLRNHILSPCPPFAKRLASNRKALLVDFVELRVMARMTSHQVSNENDLAIAALHDVVAPRNLVPRPIPGENGVWKKGPIEQLGSLVEKKELEEMANKRERVFKIGRQTDFTTGTLADAFLRDNIVLKLPDKSPILYENLCKISWDDPQLPFADQGDSGSIIYTQALRIVGFVVGSRGTETFFYHAKQALDGVGALYPPGGKGDEPVDR